MFDPYYKWLGIPPKDQPPNHYRLLGLELFESDPDVIDVAANKQMAFIRSCATGPHIAQSQKLLNEISAARLCLLNAQKKEAYDSQLRQKSAPPQPTALSPTPTPSPVATALAAVSSPISPRPVVHPQPRITGARRPQRSFPVALFAATAAGALAICALLILLSRSSPLARAPVQAAPGSGGTTSNNPTVVEDAQKPIVDQTLGPANPATTDSRSVEDGSADPATSAGKPTVPPPTSTAAPVEPPHAVVPAPTSPPRLPLPDGKELEAAERSVQEVHGKDLDKATTQPLKAALASKLWQQATSESDPAARYALFRQSRDLAVAAGDAALALQAAGDIAAAYEVDFWSLRLEVLRETGLTAKTSTARKTLAERALALVEDAVNADQYVAAKELSELAVAAARTSQDAALLKQVMSRDNDVTSLVEQYAATAEARATLQNNPTDSAANASIGKFLCFDKGDWERGLPALALGDDPQLKLLAEQDLARPREAAEQVALGDAWWDHAESEGGTEQAKGRARYWYRIALPWLSGLNKTKVARRIDEAPPGGPASKSKYSALAGTWIISYTNGAQRVYLISDAGEVLYAQTRCQLEDHGDRQLARFQGGNLELLQGAKRTLQLVHFQRAKDFPDNPLCTGTGRRIGDAEAENFARTESFQPFAGHWTIGYSNRVTRQYVINDDGYVRSGKSTGILFRNGNVVLLAFGDSKIERLRLKGDRLYIEHFNPASTYPNKVDCTGVGVRK